MLKLQRLFSVAKFEYTRVPSSTNRRCCHCCNKISLLIRRSLFTVCDEFYHEALSGQNFRTLRLPMEKAAASTVVMMMIGAVPRGHALQCSAVKELEEPFYFRIRACGRPPNGWLSRTVVGCPHNLYELMASRRTIDTKLD